MRELHILLMYAKLGRNAFLRHEEATAPELDEPTNPHQP